MNSHVPLLYPSRPGRGLVPAKPRIVPSPAPARSGPCGALVLIHAAVAAACLALPAGAALQLLAAPLTPAAVSQAGPLARTSGTGSP